MAISLLPSKVSPLTRSPGSGVPMIEGRRSPRCVTVPSRVARTEASAITSTVAPANSRACDGALDDPGEHRLEPVVIAVVEVVGLGGGEEDAVDPARDEAARASPSGRARKAARISAERLLERRPPPRDRRSARRARRPGRSGGRGGRNARGRRAAPPRSYRTRSAGPSSRRASPCGIAPSPRSSGEKVSAGEPSRSPGIRKRPGRQGREAGPVGADGAEIRR